MILKTPVIKIAKTLGVSTQAVYDWKNDKYLPNLKNCQKLAKLEKTTVDKLLK